MALRFLAMVLRHPEAASPEPAALAVLQLHRILNSRHLKIWVSDPASVLVSEDQRTLILGTLFDRSDQPVRVRKLGLDLIAPADLAPALARYWGQYLAFSQSTLGSVRVYRDPGGALPCYVLETASAVYLFSDIDLAARACGISLELDWSSLASGLVWNGLRTSRTAFSQIYELQQGNVLALGGHHYCAQTSFWSPWDHIEPAVPEGEALAAQLHTIVAGVVTAMAGQFDAIQLCLSGGLDSSIIAALLKDRKTTCLTLVTDGAEGDERRQARLVADHVRLPLVDRRYRMEGVDLSKSSACHLPRPVGAPARLAFDRANLDLAEAIGSDALFTGVGGDNVFCLMQSATPIADCVRTSGLGPRAFRAVLDVCRLTGCSVWTALARARKKLPARAGPYHWAPDSRFLSAEIMSATSPRPAHHWLDPVTDVLPGRAAHVAAIMRPQNFIEGFRRDAPIEMVTPLLSQPIVELCLSISSWDWIAGGRDRAVARQAFATMLPARTITRRSKGGPGSFYRQIVNRNRAFILERLMDGELVRRGIVDPASVEAFFKAPLDSQGDRYVRLLDLCDAEAWIEHARGRSG